MSCGLGLLANLAKAMHRGSAASVCQLPRQAKGQAHGARLTSLEGRLTLDRNNAFLFFT